MGPGDGIYEDLRQIRYKTEWIKLTKKEALEIKQRDIDHAQAVYEEAKKALEASKKAKLITKLMKYIPIKSDEPGWKDASFAFHPELYQGECVWIDSKGNKFDRFKG